MQVCGRKSISICSIFPYTFTRTLASWRVPKMCPTVLGEGSHCAWLSGEKKKKSNSNVQIEIPTSFLPLGGTLVGRPVALHRTHTQTAPSHIHMQYICRYTTHNIVYIFGLRIVIFYCTHIYIYSRRRRRRRRRRCVRTWGGLRVKTSFVAGAGKVSLLKISLTGRKFFPSAVAAANFLLQIDGRQRKLGNSKHWCLVDSPYVIVSPLATPAPCHLSETRLRIYYNTFITFVCYT